MKILEIDYDYYYYPENITCIEDFIEYANANYNTFIKLTCFDTENCVFPYVIGDETKEVYVNVATVQKISEVEATVLDRSEYDIRLEQVEKKKCIDCVYYEEHSEGDNLKCLRERISLDGECWGYEKKK